MLMTEQEAREKWCPEGRMVGKSGLMTNLDARCIGSRCAMWRWHEARPAAEEELRLGHCGLAGPTKIR